MYKNKFLETIVKEIKIKVKTELSKLQIQHLKIKL